MRLIISFLFSMLMHQLVSAASFDCGRTLCGCWTPATLDYKATIVDENDSPVTGIKIICGSEKEAIATSSNDGKLGFSIETNYSPGCHYARCTNIKIFDEKGKFEDISTTIYVTNGKKIVLTRKLK